MEHGKSIRIHKISSYFGMISVKLKSEIENHILEFKLTINSKNYFKYSSNQLRFIYIVIRHPDENKSIKEVIAQDFSSEVAKKKYTNIAQIKHQTIKISLTPDKWMDSLLEIKYKIIF